MVLVGRYHVPQDEAGARAAGFHTTLRGKVLAGYGGVCKCCGEDYWYLTDHVAGNGSADRRARGGLIGILRFALPNIFPPYLQILCCHAAKTCGVPCKPGDSHTSPWLVKAAS